MLKIFKTSRETWRDENLVDYRRLNSQEIAASDGRVLRAPNKKEIIYLDGIGNGFIFS